MIDKEALFPRVSRMEKRRQASKRSKSDFWVNAKLCMVVFLLAATFFAAGLMIYLYGFPAGIIELLPFGKASSAGAAFNGFTAANELLEVPAGAAFTPKKGKLPATKHSTGLLKPELQDKSIIINVPSRTLALYAGSRLVKRYPVAVGKISTPTPLGMFAILQKEINPLWYPPNRNLAVASGPQNPLGYRWIGFASMYGIHGTNVPEQIGTAASNGCVRMYEQDVEELFETVTAGMPVKITYDLINVTVDGKGQVFVSAYPDIYGYKTERLIFAEIRDKFALYRLEGFAGEGILRSIVSVHTGQPILFAKVHKIKVNGRTLEEWAVSIDGVTLVPVWPLAEAFQRDVIWNDYNNTIRCGEQFVSGVVKGDVIYITPDSALALFGGVKLWNLKDNSLEFGVQLLGKRR